MSIQEQKKEIKEQLLLLGKEVADSYSTTQFPDSILLKIGIDTVKEIPYEYEYYERHIETKKECDGDS